MELPPTVIRRTKSVSAWLKGSTTKSVFCNDDAYGYRDNEYLKLKIVAAFLPPLPRNDVFNPHESA